VQFGLTVDIYDPWANKQEVKKQFEIDLVDTLPIAAPNRYDAIILAVSHSEFTKLDLSKLLTSKTVIFDTKAVLDRTIVDGRL
jgi:UDP-N-acetyl-D-galactosamine dehydrogenase